MVERGSFYTISGVAEHEPGSAGTLDGGIEVRPKGVITSCLPAPGTLWQSLPKDFFPTAAPTTTPMPKDRWFVLCEKAGLDGRAGSDALSSAYGDPGRAYHNLNHIGDCLLRFDEHARLAADPVAVEFAIWFHDIVYDTRAADNEERSAVTAAEFLSTTTLGPEVAELIRATKHDSTPPTRDAALLCDIDLSILGREPNEYDAYSRAVRQEYAWVPFLQYAAARIRVLEGFLRRPAIFVLAELEDQFGKQAKVNLGREIDSLANPEPAFPGQPHLERQ